MYIVLILLSYCSMLVQMKKKLLFGLDNLETINYAYLYNVTSKFTQEMTLIGQQYAFILNIA